jgi:hypothetical protein
LFALAVVLFVVALLRFGGSNHYQNRRTAVLIWQVRSQNTDWWLEINRKKQD